MKRSPLKRRPRRRVPIERLLMRDARSVIIARSQGRCERCGHALGLSWECHHRKRKSQGGPDAISNLIALHPDCHNVGSPGSVHAEPSTSYSLGYLVRFSADPAETPLLLFGRRWVLLTPYGSYLDSEAPR